MVTKFAPYQHKRSYTPGAQPNTSQLQEGEVALNIADGAIYTKTSANAIIQLGITRAEYATRAPLASPAFTGTPTAPTAAQGTDNQQIATTAFVNAAVSAAQQGLDVKESVRVLSAANVNIAAPGATIDGIAMVAGDRVLLTGQSTASQNGLYTWNGASSAMTRTTDANTSAKVSGGLFTFVSEGTYADSGWVLTTDSSITLGSTALTFTQFSGAGQITAGSGLTKSGNTIAISTSATLPGTPSIATSPAVDDNSTKVASTAWFIAQLGTTTPQMNGTASAGSSYRVARADHVHPTDTTRAPVASPAFTGTPTAPTATPGTNTAQLATTEFVTTAVAPKANVASPTFTGTPSAPTAAAGTNTTQLATTAFVTAAANTVLAATEATFNAIDGGTF